MGMLDPLDSSQISAPSFEVRMQWWNQILHTLQTISQVKVDKTQIYNGRRKE